MKEIMSRMDVVHGTADVEYEVIYGDLYSNKFRVFIDSKEGYQKGALRGYVYSTVNQSWGLLLDFPMTVDWESWDAPNVTDDEKLKRFRDDANNILTMLVKITGVRSAFPVDVFIEGS